jgi:hypothetical protein
VNAEAMGALGILVGAVASALVVIINARAKNKLEEKEGTIRGYEKIVDRQDREITRHAAHGDEQQDLIHRQQEDNTVLRERLANLRGRYDLLYDYARRQSEAMKKAGLPTEPPPELLPDVQRELQAMSADADFEVRQAEQAAATIKALKKTPAAARPGPGAKADGA